ncbi:death domain-containing protein CRADD [Ictalurus punctatus]|uniref:death domain-containing protein CRADD n=1 Tax=Ictalurus punctatus TaxID=7998 RepID=E3TGN4_ICTPU|nr:death domain-containing protein CRADD [Ictalurus punctatus]ADO29470.1 death domain-containing protein cradd [Ictalurus punctatus]
MEPKHRDLLRAQRLHLCEQLVVDETIVQYLYQEDILTEGQVEEIQSQKSNKNKTLLLLSILPNRGPNAFNVFVQSLEQDFPWIKEKLLLLADEDEQDGGRGTELSNTTAQWAIPKDILQMVPSDQQLNRLAARLGLEWEMVLLDLGLTSVEITRCRADHPHSSHSQVLAALVMWKQTQGRSATVQRLLQSLQYSEIHPSSLSQVFV